MRSSRTLRRVALAAILSVAFLFQGTWALAATTGGLAGVVHDDTGAPIAGATVTATSPSQVATTTTDAQGHFVFLVLQPDTYTLTVAKDGYQTTSIAGNTVFADQTQQIVLTAPRAIKVIQHVYGTAAGLVKPGVAGDIYNVTPSQQAASVALGGGGNLNSAYSAIASVPGVYLGTGSSGWDQAVVIHGENPFFTSYEVDSIPVNRAFDNYPNTTETSLGLQELQIYTGGGPADITSNGVSGFINTVIKTGTYPGYADLTLGTASEAFWHLATVEVGGATPDRNFSYYVGISGYDQQFRYVDNSDGASLMTDGNIYQARDPYFTVYSATGAGVTQNCEYGTDVPPAGSTNGCYATGWGLYGSQAAINDRENIINLHFGIPRADGQRDDIQALWMSSMLQTLANGYNGSAGPGLEEADEYLGYGTNPLYPAYNYFGYYFCNCTTPSYIASYTYNMPFGSVVNNAAGTDPKIPTLYAFPSSPASVYADGCAGYTAYIGGTGDQCSLPSDDPTLDSNYNDLGALKLQWTHPFNDTSYMRIFAYSLYSDWLENSPTSGATLEYFAPFGLAPDYELNSHTAGGSFAYTNQVTDANLFSFEANIETSETLRYNNYFYDSWANAGSEIGLVSRSGACTTASGVHYSDCYTCYDQDNYYGNGAGAAMPCSSAGWGYDGDDTSEVNALYGEAPITGAAAAAGAQYISLWNADTTGEYNTVRPLFWNMSLEDQFRPNDKWLFDVALRYDDFTENLADGVNPTNDFQAQVIDNDVCWNPTLGVLTYALTPGEPPPAPIDYVSGTCPTTTIGTKTYTYVHPPFSDANTTGNQYTTSDWEPRFAFTYTQDPDTVWRFSAGRYAQPALSAADQYLFYAGGTPEADAWASFLDQGFMSPEHEIPNMTAAQYNASFEHRFRGTNVSIKLSPFYTATSNWLEDNFIGENYVTQIPTGRAKNYGVEFSLQDGDFNSNGLSGMLAFTWTVSLVEYQPLLGLNQISQLNTQISNYNSLTKAGGGSECYTPYTGPGTGVAGPCNGTNILNPYYNQPEQPLLNQNAWYPQNEVAMAAPANYGYCTCYNAPYVTALVLNWRHDRFAVTPSLQLESGAQYGSPLDVDGVDPRDCGENQNSSGVDLGNDLCDYHYAGIGAGPYGYLAVPDPQTGTFASPGQYYNPNILIGNLQLSYDFPHVKLLLTATDLWHTCFGGSSEPWTTAYPPSSTICGYSANGLYNGAGWYDGSSPYDKAANGVTPYAWEQQSYGPSTGGVYTSYLPFNLYLQAQIHL